MTAVFAAQRNGALAAYAAMVYSGTPAGGIRCFEAPDATSIVGDNIVMVSFGEEIADIAIFDAADGIDIEAIAQETIICSIAVSDAADGASIAASILVPVIATVNTSDLADGTAIAITGEGTATASMAVADVADGTSITGYTTLVAQIAVNDSADGSAIQGAGQLWLPVVLTPTSWVNVNA